MNLKTLTVHARKNARLVLVLVVAGIVLGGLVAVLSGKQYEATTRLLVSPNAPLLSPNPAIGNGVSSAQDAAIYTQQRALTYAQIVTSPAVVGAAQQTLGSAFPNNDLGQHIVVNVVPTTSLIDISVTADDPDIAAQAANAVAKALADVVQTAERIGDTHTSAVKIVPISPATPPKTPSSPALFRALIIGGIVGLLIGIIVAAVRALFDSSIMTEEALAEVAGAPAVATIAADRRLSGRMLVVADAPASAAADDFRRLRASLQFADLDKPPRCIVVTGAMKDAGATTVAGNLALSFAQVGCRAVLIDADLRDRAASAAFGLADRPGLGQVLEGGLELTAALQEHQPSGLQVLPAGQSDRTPGDALGGSRLADVLRELEERSDVVIVDSPPAASPETRSLAAIAHGTVVVVRHAYTTALELEQALQGLRGVHSRVVGTVLSRMTGVRRR